MIRLIALLAAASVVAADDKPDPKADLAAIQGKWKVTTLKFDGRAMAPVERYLTFDEKEYTAIDGGKKGRTLAFTLDPTTKPKKFDTSLKGDDQKAAGLYILDGDKLTICYGEPGAARPASLEPREGEKVFLMELVRVKK